jgi:hypothetical protein
MRNQLIKPQHHTKFFHLTLLLVMAMLLSFSTIVGARSYWDQSDESTKQVIDHSQWQLILDHYLIIGVDVTAVNYFNYKSVSASDKEKLSRYVAMLQTIDPLNYTRAQQQAYWINLYNALTVKLILDNYPVKSITKLGNKFFSFGPWDDNAARVNSKDLTLNDIEHKILRPIWRDPRIHYAVNCASYGCPNLSSSAFTAENAEQQLEAGAYAYINHPRGVTIAEENIVLSSIYKWYSEDFGDDRNMLLTHLKQYAKPELNRKLSLFQQGDGDIDYEYDWRLNAL